MPSLPFLWPIRKADNQKASGAGVEIRRGSAHADGAREAGRNNTPPDALPSRTAESPDRSRPRFCAVHHQRRGSAVPSPPTTITHTTVDWHHTHTNPRRGAGYRPTAWQVLCMLQEQASEGVVRKPLGSYRKMHGNAVRPEGAGCARRLWPRRRGSASSCTRRSRGRPPRLPPPPPPPPAATHGAQQQPSPEVRGRDTSPDVRV